MTPEIKIGLFIVALVLITGTVWKIHDVGYQSGVNDEKVKTAAAVAGSIKEDENDVKEIIKWKERERIVYRDRVKTIRLAADPTGCLDHDLRDVGLDSLLRSDSDKARPLTPVPVGETGADGG